MKMNNTLMLTYLYHMSWYNYMHYYICSDDEDKQKFANFINKFDT